MQEPRAEIEQVYPLNLEIGDFVFVYSVRHGRKLAVKIEDILITTGGNSEKLYHIVTPDKDFTLTYPHDIKLAVLRH